MPDPITRSRPRRFAVRRAIGALALCLSGAAFAQGNPDKDPFGYPLRQYGLVLATAILGGLVSWYAKLRRGEVAAHNLLQLVGELCTSAFAGLIAFWLCEWAGLSQMLTAPLVGIAGHMGTRAIQAFEAMAQRRWGAIGGETGR